MLSVGEQNLAFRKFTEFLLSIADVFCDFFFST